MKSTIPQCAKCGTFRCKTLDKGKRLPGNCPTGNYPDIIKQTIEKQKTDPSIHAINEAWVELLKRIGKDRYSWTRLDEVIEYAKIRGVKKIGIATCFALIPEAKMLTSVLEENDFEVVSVSCLAGEVSAADVDIVREGVFCNPILQAEVLNREGTELNIMVGLCVGHDILFLRHSKADVTPLIVKDKATGHNPVAALYMSAGYYRDRFIKKKASKPK